MNASIYVLAVPAQTLATVEQQYDADFMTKAGVRHIAGEVSELVAIPTDLPEAFDLLLRLKSECDRVTLLMLAARDAGMETPFPLDLYGQAKRWSRDSNGEASSEDISLVGMSL